MSAPTSSHRRRRPLRARAASRPWLAAVASVAALLSVAFAGCGLETSGTAERPTAQPCAAPSDCDDQNPCTLDACGDDGLCQRDPAPDGPADQQIGSDCLTLACVAGELVELPSDTDFVDDANDCTADTCLDGQPRNTPHPDGGACVVGEAQGLCQNGQCAVACGNGLPPCDDQNPCTDDACDAATAQCAFTPRHGVPPVDHVEPAGNCQLTLCVDGVQTSLADPDDWTPTPTDCDEETCEGGVQVNLPLAAGTACAAGVCDGLGSCGQCNAPTDCATAPSDDECRATTCVNHVCGQTFTGAGTPITAQAPGDCQIVVCDGSGNTTSVADNADVLDDGNECTTEACDNGVLVTDDVPANQPCGQGGALYCDGDGACVGCTMADQCPAGTFCGQATCINQQCGYQYTAAGTPLPDADQTAGDCKARQCTGDSLTPVEVALGTDVPVEDGNQCTQQTCNGSDPAFPPVSVNTPCNQNGGAVCSDAGACVQCNAAAQCPPGGNACVMATCTGNTCGFMNVAAGTPLTDTIAGDCRRPECDGNGGIILAPFGMDLPNDSNECTLDTCNAGMPEHTPVDADTPCSQNGGSVCSPTGVCVQCNSAPQCPPGANACVVATCASNTCGFMNVAAGTPQPDTTAGDCQQPACDGNGGFTSIPLDTDLPDDGQECTTDSCNAGAPEYTPVMADTPCTQDGGVVCSAAGTCVECNASAQCPASANACETAACTNNACGFTPVAAGTPQPDMTTGDCQRPECDGNGGTTLVPLDTDLPNDGQECTTDSCNAGMPVHTPVAEGTSCDMGAGVCSSAGTCVECNTASECPPSANPCEVAACTNNTCGFTPVAAGTPQPDTTTGDCQQPACDGTGGLTSIPLDSDVFNDGQECTSDSCNAGMPVHTPVADDTPCNMGTGVCSAGMCVQCNDASQCPASANPCEMAACTNNTCGFTPVAFGTAQPDTTPGDCQQPACDGAGGLTSIPLDSDVPDDGQECTTDSCNAGTPEYTPLADGDSCTQNGGEVCISGTCEPLIADGQTCTIDEECASGSCADDVCCDSACDQACEACNLPGSEGLCLPDPSLAGQQDLCQPGETCDAAGICTAP